MNKESKPLSKKELLREGYKELAEKYRLLAEESCQLSQSDEPKPDELLLTDEEIKDEAVASGLIDIPELCSVEQSEIDVFKPMLKAQLAKVLPAREELDKLREQIGSLNTKLDDREIDLLEAKKEGMKEVAEWIENNHGELGTIEQPALTINSIKWQVFLKSKGIE